MSTRNNDKKLIEARVLAAARNAGAPIPIGEIPGEEPDFRIATATGTLGIELSELLRPASSNCGIVPVEEESFHKEIVRLRRRVITRLQKLARRASGSILRTLGGGDEANEKWLADLLNSSKQTFIGQNL